MAIPTGDRPLAPVFVALLFFLTSPRLQAEVTPDASRAFDQGRPVLLPGTSLYRGDLPHDIALGPVGPSLHSLMGEAALQVGWRGPGILPASPTAIPPAVLFEGIAHPWGGEPLRWLPSLPGTEFLEMPASAWWGVGTLGGALLLSAGPGGEGKGGDLAVWGGDGPWATASGLYRGKDHYAAAQTSLDPSGWARGAFVGGVDWLGPDDPRLRTTVLLARGRQGEGWEVVTTRLSLPMGPFQSLQVRPFFQWAGEGPASTSQLGWDGHYKFDMGGLAQAQVGAGSTHSRSEGVPGLSDQDEGFLQGGFQGDILGMLVGDLALRLDLLRASAPLGFLVGLQALQEDLTWRADLAKGDRAQGGPEVLEGSIGLHFQPDEHFDLSLKCFHEEGEIEALNGVRGVVAWKLDRPLAVLRSMEGAVHEKLSWDGGGRSHWDTAVRAALSFFGPDLLWLQGRGLSGGPLFMEGGFRLELVQGWWLDLHASGLGESSIPWPDPDSPQGPHFLGGLEGNF